MILLQWGWTVRLGPYLRAAFATQPVLVATPAVAALASAFLAPDELGLLGAVLSGVLAAVLAVPALVGVVGLQLWRLRRAAGAEVQWYAITEDAIEVAAGQDRHSLPRHGLRVTRSGPGWVQLRRRGAGGRRMVLFFDDPRVAPHAMSLLAPVERRRPS